MVGIITLARALILSNLIEERDDFELKRRHKVAAVAIGATTGFVIGITSAGSGTVIAILLIAVFRLTPVKVVGTDVFHAAILLWAAGIAHWVGGNVDFMLAGNILLGCVPGRDRRLPLRRPGADRVPAHRARRRPRSPPASSPCRRAIRSSGRSPPPSPASASVLLIWFPRWWNERRVKREAAEASKQARPLRRSRA